MSETLRQQFLQKLGQTSDAPLLLEISSAEGNYLIDKSGKKYLDLISGISVSHLGHRHPAVIEAIENQLHKHNHVMVYGELVQDIQVQYADALTAILPRQLNSCYFTNSGAEAVEGAMKLAKRFTGRTDFVAMKKAYHGSTQGALSLMSEEYYNASYRPLLPNIHFIDQNHLDELAVINKETAAVFVEPVMGEKGASPCSAGFLKALRKRCDETGTLLVFDEIQTGFGRTGSFFAFEQYDVIPDILLLGKALGGGLPLGAFLAERNMMKCISKNPVLGHITTFGGHPLSCAAGLAALEVLKSGFAEFDIKGKSEFLQKKLAPAGQVNGLGLLLSLDLGTAEKVKDVIEKSLIKGVFTDWFLYAPDKLRLAPPLTITYEEIALATESLLASIVEM